MGAHHLVLFVTKPIFGVSEKARLKPISSATDTSYKTEISHVANFDIVLYKTRITKALIRLRGCAGWSAPVLFANPRRQVSSRCGPFSHSAIHYLVFFLVFAIILTRKRLHDALLYRLSTISVLWLFLMVPWIGLNSK